MLTLYYAPGACSMAAHIVLEESGEKYTPQRVDLAKGEQKTEAYLKIHSAERVDLEIGLGLLLALGEVDALRRVFLATLLQHDMRRHRACAGGVVERQHREFLLRRLLIDFG